MTRLRVGRVLLLALLTGAALIGGTVWLLTTKARPFVTPTVDSTAWPAWLRQAQTYPTTPPEPPKPAESAPDPNAALLAKLGLLQAELSASGRNSKRSKNAQQARPSCRPSSNKRPR